MRMQMNKEEQLRLEQDRAIEQYRALQARRCRLGRMLVIAVSVTHIVLSLLRFFVEFNPLHVLIVAGFATAMLCGVAWARYVLATYAVIDVTVVLFAVCSYHIGFDDPRYTALSATIIMLYVLIGAVSAALLYTNKAMSLYFYERKKDKKKKDKNR